MTESKPTPEKQNLPATPDENTSSPERDGFFKRVRRELKPEPVHPSEAAEIVIMEGDGDGDGDGDQM